MRATTMPIMSTICENSSLRLYPVRALVRNNCSIAAADNTFSNVPRTITLTGALSINLSNTEFKTILNRLLLRTEIQTPKFGCQSGSRRIASYSERDRWVKLANESLQWVLIQS